MRKAALLVAGVAVVGLSVASVPAEAAVTYSRLSGTYKPTLTITSHKAKPSDKGTKLSGKPWKFAPKCTGTNGCATVLKRTRYSDASVVTTTLAPSVVKGKTNYKGVATYKSNCYRNSDGSLLVANGYSTKETTTLVVTGTGNAATFTGTLALTFTPTAAAKRAGCAIDAETSSIASGKRTGA